MRTKDRPLDLIWTEPPGRVTCCLIISCLSVSLPALLRPEIGSALGGIGYLAYPWQPWTAAFLHGWPGFPLLLHLALNLILLTQIGRWAEALLGSARFLLLTIASIALYGIASAFFRVQANGASVFIWSYAPVVWWVALKNSQATPLVGPSVRRDLRTLLTVMWVIVPLALVLFLYLGGVPLRNALLYGNLFHLTATMAGLAAALGWGEKSRQQFIAGKRPSSRWDGVARGLAVAMVLALAGLAVWALVIRP